jgi:hypothetical protein
MRCAGPIRESEQGIRSNRYKNLAFAHSSEIREIPRLMFSMVCALSFGDLFCCHIVAHSPGWWGGRAVARLRPSTAGYGGQASGEWPVASLRNRPRCNSFPVTCLRKWRPGISFVLICLCHVPGEGPLESSQGQSRSSATGRMQRVAKMVVRGGGSRVARHALRGREIQTFDCGLSTVNSRLWTVNPRALASLRSLASVARLRSSRCGGENGTRRVCFHSP